MPIPKGGKAIDRSLKVDGYRGISISPVLSKILEHCILDLFKRFFVTSDNQFGFKKGLSCSQAIYSVRCVVNKYIEGGSTVSICALDLSKAFDKVNHFALLSKLMTRNVPVLLLRLVERWFSLASTCVKWGGYIMYFFKVFAGVRQGDALSPCLFVIYVDDVVKKIYNSGLGCNLSFICTSVFLYADDILLLSPSVHALQAMLLICEQELLSLDICLNHNKSVCIRVGHVLTPTALN